MSHEPAKINPAQWVLKYWVIIVFLIGSVTVWTTLKNTVDGHTNDIVGVKKDLVTAINANNQILVELSAIRTDLLWIKSKWK